MFRVWDVDDILMPRSGWQYLRDVVEEVAFCLLMGGIYVLSGKTEIAHITGEWALDLKEAQG